MCFSRLYLGQTLVQILPLAQHEYINAYGTNSWRETIRTSHEQSADHISPDPESRAPEHEPDSAPALLPRRHRTHLPPPNRTEFVEKHKRFPPVRAWAA